MLGEFEYLLLAASARLGEEAYGPSRGEGLCPDLDG
jgi:hypothetical protein